MVSLLVATLGILVSATLANPTLPPVPPSECRSLMDTIFIVDGSHSVSAIDYVKQRKALAAILNKLDLGPQQARVGIVVYSSTIAQWVPLSHDRAKLTRNVLNMARPGHGTHTHVGIAKMIEMFKKDGRPNVPWVSIVITDGDSKFPNETRQQAAHAKAMGVNMFAVGLSNLILREELEAIASSSSQVLELPSFDQLRASLSKLLMKVVCLCENPPSDVYSVAIDLSPRPLGGVVEYQCLAGYVPTGAAFITCLPGATWSPLMIACSNCRQPPPTLYMAELSSLLPTEGINVGDSVIYTCLNGYISDGVVNVTCQGDLQWSAQSVDCRGCNPKLLPTIPRGAVVQSIMDDAMIGTEIKYECEKGFLHNYTPSDVCLDSAQWSLPLFECVVSAFFGGNCPDNWIEHNDSCYWFATRNRSSFDGAERFCQQLGGSLVQVDNVAENTFLKNYLQDHKSDQSWMGLTDAISEGKWVWKTTNISPEFTDWSPRQPDNIGGADCGVFGGARYDYRWDDVTCSLLFQPLCESFVSIYNKSRYCKRQMSPIAD